MSEACRFVRSPRILARPNLPAALLGGILLLAVSLCSLSLGRGSIDTDEATSVLYSNADWRFFWSAISYDANMALYYSLLHVWVGLGLGTNEFFVRLLSVILAVATIPLIFALGERLSRPRVGLLAALFLALNTFYVQYAQEARSYSLLLFLVTLSYCLYIKCLEHPSTAAWIGYVLVTALGVYAHLFTAFILVAQWMSLITARPRAVRWRSIIMSAMAICLLCLPMALFALFRNTGQVSSVPPFKLSSLYTGLYLTGGYPWLDRLGGRLLMFVYVVLCVLGLSSIVRTRSTHRDRPEALHCDILLGWFIVPIVLTVGTSLVAPLWVVRYLIIVLPALVLIAAQGVGRIPDTRMRLAVLAVAVLLMGRALYVYQASFPKEDWRAATTYILTEAQPNDALLFDPIRQPYDYYSAKLRTQVASAIEIPSIVDYALALQTRLGRDISDPSKVGLETSLSRFRRVWLLSHDNELGDTRGDKLQAFLASHGTLLTVRQFYRVKVFLYSWNHSAN